MSALPSPSADVVAIASVRVREAARRLDMFRHTTSRTAEHELAQAMTVYFAAAEAFFGRNPEIRQEAE